MACNGISVCLLLVAVATTVDSQWIIDGVCNEDMDKSVTFYTMNAKGYFLYVGGCVSTQGEFSGSGIPSDRPSEGEVTITDCNLEWGKSIVGVLARNQGFIFIQDWPTSFAVTCTHVTDPMSIQAGITVSPGTAAVTGHEFVSPPITLKFTVGTDDKDGPSIHSAVLGDLLRAHVFIPDSYAVSAGVSGFDIRVLFMEVSSGSVTVPLTDDGCQVADDWAPVTDEGQGYQRVEYNAFMVGGSATAASYQLFIVVVEVCAGISCPPYTCTRKRRDVTNGTTVETLRLTGRMKIRPYRDSTYEEESPITPSANDVKACEVCQNEGLFAVVAMLGAATLLSVAISVFLFRRLKRQQA